MTGWQWLLVGFAAWLVLVCIVATIFSRLQRYPLSRDEFRRIHEDWFE